MKKHLSTGRKNGARDPNQVEFGVIWELSEYPFKLRAGDVFKFNERLCRVLRVNDSSAVVIMSLPVREFKTRFDKPVGFQPPPKRFYISPNSEVAVLHRKARP
jgi:hypothetical protein